MVMHVLEMVALGAIALYVGVCALAVGWLLAALAVERLRRPAPVEEIVAVAGEGLTAAPELADDEAAAARTVSLTDAALDGTLVLVVADPRPEPLVDRIRVEKLLIEIDRCVECYRHGQDITAGAPKEWTP